MSDPAYDISYLLDNEPSKTGVRDAPVARTVPEPPPSQADIQAAMARELLQAGEAHEEWIRQYLAVHRRDDTGHCPG